MNWWFRFPLLALQCINLRYFKRSILVGHRDEGLLTIFENFCSEKILTTIYFSFYHVIFFLAILHFDNYLKKALSIILPVNPLAYKLTFINSHWLKHVHHFICLFWYFIERADGLVICSIAKQNFWNPKKFHLDLTLTQYIFEDLQSNFAQGAYFCILYLCQFSIFALPPLSELISWAYEWEFLQVLFFSVQEKKWNRSTHIEFRSTIKDKAWTKLLNSLIVVSKLYFNGTFDPKPFPRAIIKALIQPIFTTLSFSDEGMSSENHSFQWNQELTIQFRKNLFHRSLCFVLSPSLESLAWQAELFCKMPLRYGPIALSGLP